MFDPGLRTGRVVAGAGFRCSRRGPEVSADEIRGGRRCGPGLTSTGGRARPCSRRRPPPLVYFRSECRTIASPITTQIGDRR